ncbi:MAG: ribosome silencing factor [Oscillospiraceae bacterium]|nr:ribosome silencing factor [Oscillospiraceae bacterium]
MITLNIGEIKVDSLELAKALVKALDDKKGDSIEVLHVEELTTLADYFVLATGGSTTQVRALADEVEETAEKLGLDLPRREGRGGDSWILLDLGSVIVHVFTKESREYYQLEKLWGDAPVVSFEKEKE